MGRRALLGQEGRGSQKQARIFHRIEPGGENHHGRRGRDPQLASCGGTFGVRSGTEPVGVDAIRDNESFRPGRQKRRVCVAGRLGAGDVRGQQSRRGCIAEPLERRAGVCRVGSVQARGDRDVGHQPAFAQREQQPDRLFLQRQDDIGPPHRGRGDGQLTFGERRRPGRIRTDCSIECRHPDAGLRETDVTRVRVQSLQRCVTARGRGDGENAVALVKPTVKSGDDVGMQDARPTGEETLVQRQDSNRTVHRDAFQKLSGWCETANTRQERRRQNGRRFNRSDNAGGFGAGCRLTGGVHPVNE